jgi:hypothetical protein
MLPEDFLFTASGTAAVASVSTSAMRAIWNAGAHGTAAAASRITVGVAVLFAEGLVVSGSCGVCSSSAMAL